MCCSYFSLCLVSVFTCILRIKPTTKTTIILWLSGLYLGQPGEPVPEETFTHSHQSWSSIILYLLLPSFTIHGIHLVQFTCLTVFFHNLCPSFLGLLVGLAPSTSCSIHFFTQSLSSFHSTCPYHHNLFCCSIEIMSFNPSLSLNPLLATVSFCLTPHVHRNNPSAVVNPASFKQ